MHKISLLFLLVFNLGMTFHSTAQRSDTTLSKKYPQHKVSGLFQSRFLVGLTNGVDVLEQHHTDGKAVQNTFDIKRMRVQLTTELNEKIEVATLVNLADFKNDPKGKVLENAFVRYSFNPNFYVKMGQFRPAFGFEDFNIVDFVKSLDYSNQYYEFAKNGWMSFQLGAGVGGKIKAKLPFSYEFSLVNGNNRNQVSDNENGKQLMARCAVELSKKHQTKIGASGGFGKFSKQNIYVYGFDASCLYKISDNCTFDVQTEFKNGLNQSAYFSNPDSLRIGKLKDYKMLGFYILPNLQWKIYNKNLQGIEFSCRYEYLDINKFSSNPRQTLLPMLGFDFLENARAKLQIGFQIDRYEHIIPQSSQFSNNLVVLQVQARL